MGKKIFTERPAARAFVGAIADGAAARARRFATPRVVDQAMDLRRPGQVMDFGGCIGRNNAAWPSWVETDWTRMCYLSTYFPDSNDGDGSGYGLFMGNKSWRTFEAKQLEGIAG